MTKRAPGTKRNPSAQPDMASRVCFYLLLAFILLAPLFRSGKTPMAAMALELLALGSLLLLFWGGTHLPRLAKVERVFLVALAALPLMQLIPLPGISRLSLPGQADYYTALELVGHAATTTLSVIPRETFLGWLILLVPIAVFMLTRALDVSRLRVVLVFVLAMAAFQAILGLLQYGTGDGGPFMLGLEGKGGGLAKGTWRGRNNYAGFLYSVLMVSLALFIATLGRHNKHAGHQTLRQKLVYFSTMQGHKAFLFGALSVLIILAVVFSRSRTGIGLTMVGVVLAGVVFARRIGGENVYGLTGTIMSVGLSLGIAVGLGPVLERFSSRDPFSDGRWIIFDGVLDGIARFFPFGAGSGTFEQTFLPFQALSFSQVTVNQAHNSYLEWLFNGGVFALGLMVAFGVIFIMRWISVWKKGVWGEFRYIQVGCGLGVLLTLMHETVDFNLFVPANMVYFAFFAGLFFHPFNEPPLPVRTRGATAEMPGQRSRPRLQPVGTAEPATNPFMD